MGPIRGARECRRSSILTEVNVDSTKGKWRVKLFFQAKRGFSASNHVSELKRLYPKHDPAHPKWPHRQKDQYIWLSSLRWERTRDPYRWKSVQRRLSCSALRGWAALSKPLLRERNTRMWIFELISSSVIAIKVFHSNTCRPLLYDFTNLYRKNPPRHTMNQFYDQIFLRVEIPAACAIIILLSAVTFCVDYQ